MDAVVSLSYRSWHLWRRVFHEYEGDKMNSAIFTRDKRSSRKASLAFRAASSRLGQPHGACASLAAIFKSETRRAQISQAARPGPVSWRSRSEIAFGTRRLPGNSPDGVLEAPILIFMPGRRSKPRSDAQGHEQDEMAGFRLLEKSLAAFELGWR